MKNKKIAVGFVGFVIAFAFITLANKYNLTVKKYSVIEDVEKIMLQNQQDFYRSGEPKEGDLEKLVKNIEGQSREDIKRKYNIDLQNVKSEMIKENGKTYITLKADIKNKLSVSSKNIKLQAKSEPQLFYRGDSVGVTKE